MYTRPYLALCHHCGEPTAPLQLTELTVEAARAGDLRETAQVCGPCAARLEALAEEYALEDANAEAELDVFDARVASYREHLEQWLASLDADHDTPSMPWSLAWCRDLDDAAVAL